MAQGLLDLKSSPGKDNIVEAKCTESKSVLNNLHWSLEAIYKFIEVNDFTQIEHQEIEVKLQEILDLLNSKLVPQEHMICKIEEKAGDKKESVKKEEKAETGEGEVISVICKIEENKGEKADQKESEKKADTGVKKENTDVVNAEKKKSQKKENTGVKKESLVKAKKKESEKKEDMGVKKESTDVVNAEKIESQKKENTAVKKKHC